MTDRARNDLLMRLLEAFERYYRTLSEEDPEGRRSFEEIACWFESRDKGDPGAFERICEQLDLDPDGIRTSLERRRSEILGSRAPKGPRRP